MIAPVKGKITSPFGERKNPFTQEEEFHNGIDISCYYAWLVAPEDGEVCQVWTDDLNGKAMRIKHTNGFYTGYAHLNKQLFKVGDKVKKGEKFAQSGNSGKSTKPHLHFTLKDKDLNSVDPLLHIKKEEFL